MGPYRERRRARVSWAAAFTQRYLEPPNADNVAVQASPTLTLGEVWRRFWPDVRPLRWMVLLSTAMATVASAITIVEIGLFKYVVDDVLVPADLGPLVWIGSAYIGLAVLSGLLSGADSYLSTWLAHTFLTHLRTRVFSHVLSLPQEVHDRRRLGDSMMRITSDTGAVQSFMISTVKSGVSTVVTCIFYLTALLLLDVWLTLVSLVVIPTFWYVSHKFSRLIKLTAREQRRRGGSLSAMTEEHLGNAPLVQTFNRQTDATSKYLEENLGIQAAALASTRVRAVFSPVVDIAELVGVLTVIVLGTQSLASGRLTLGGLLAFLTLMVQLYKPMRSLATLIPGMLTDAAGCERIAELLDERPPPERPDAEELPQDRCDLTLDNVSYTYTGASRSALSEVSLRLEPDTVVAVVGPSGAGKSTLVKLILRALDPQEGAVRIGGHDLRDVTLHSIREAVSLVPQEIALLDASVFENIAFARRGAELAQVERAARAAAAEDFILALPEGYETTLGQKARTLSGGQRQRLSIARAFLRDSPVLLLDEPTAGLDPDSARRVLEPLRGGDARGRTTIIVTHDPVALEIADRVITLDHGRVASDVTVLDRERVPASA